MVVGIVKYILLLIMLFFVQCKSVELTTYKNTKLIKGNTAEKKAVKEKIDKGKTYEITFILKNDEECIRIEMNSQVFEKLIEKKVKIKTFFILEKLIDLSKFSNINKNYQYSEIARNYDYNWNTKPEIKICSDENPLKELNKNNKYRIRFTTFNNKDFNYTVIIQSENGIISEENQS